MVLSFQTRRVGRFQLEALQYKYSKYFLRHHAQMQHVQNGNLRVTLYETCTMPCY